MGPGCGRFWTASPTTYGEKKEDSSKAPTILKTTSWWRPETSPKRYSSGKNHIQGTTETLLLAIFDSMKKVHGMGARERLLLQIAVPLHDCGKYMSHEQMWRSALTVSSWLRRSSACPQKRRRVIASAVRYNTTEFVYYGNNTDNGPVNGQETVIFWWPS